MNRRVPIAWLQLAKEKRRLAAAIAGVSFAVILMLVQLGFKDALLNSAGVQWAHLKGEIALVNPKYQFLLATGSFTERRLYQALAVDGVESVAGIYCGQAPWKNPVTRNERTIFLMAFAPKKDVFNLPEVDRRIGDLRESGKILFDEKARPEFGPVAEQIRSGRSVSTELAGKKVEVAGLFPMGTSFGIDGTAILSDETFLRVFPHRRQGIVDIGLITLKPGADAERIRKELAALLPKDVDVLSHAGLVNLERDFWEKSTPVGFVFTLGVTMGVIVGSIIVYQILYTDVSDHLDEYATLKAIGYRDGYLFRIVLAQAAILSVFGFLPGMALSQLVYVIAGNATLLPLRMNTVRCLVVYLLTLIMCLLSGAMAMRKLKSADPAEIL